MIIKKPSFRTFNSSIMYLFPKIFLRHISTTSVTTRRKLLKSSKIPKWYQKRAVRQAQKVLTDYLHETRSLPFVVADQIGQNSLISLVNLILKVDYSASDFSRNFEKYLRYNPISEFEFFFESIGIDCNNGISGLLPVNKVFFSEDRSILDAACELSSFGFPWDKLGKLYGECSSIFRRSPAELKSKLCELKEYGFRNVEVTGICLAFPYILADEDEFDGLLTDLKSVFIDYELARSVEGNIDSWHQVCRKIGLFYNLNGEKGRLGELMGRAKAIFIEFGEDELIEKIDYFCRFGFRKEEIARLLLKTPELLNLDLKMQVISVSEILKHFGLSPKILEDVSKNYDHVLGTNKMVNLPNVIRALNLHEWFLNKMKDENHKLLISYLACHPNEEQDKEYLAGLEMICVSKTHQHKMRKLNCLHGLGFGENALTLNIALRLHGTGKDLQKRFEFLLHLGFEFSDLCSMVKREPHKILNQETQVIDKKVKFFCHKLGIPLKSLIPCAAVLGYNLENHIKPRYRFHMWLKEKGFPVQKFSPVTVIASSSNRFVKSAYKIHPAAPKHWLEQFYIPQKHSSVM